MHTYAMCYLDITRCSGETERSIGALGVAADASVTC